MEPTAPAREKRGELETRALEKEKAEKEKGSGAFSEGGVNLVVLSAFAMSTRGFTSLLSIPLNRNPRAEPPQKAS